MIVKVKCIHYTYDWSYNTDVKIELDDYVFFQIDYRGRSSWHIIGYYYKDDEWKQKELSDAGVISEKELAKFIVETNRYRKNEVQSCRVSRFNSLHYDSSFYGELEELLQLVKKYEEGGME